MTAIQLLQMLVPAIVAALGASIPLLLARRADRERLDTRLRGIEDRLTRIEARLDGAEDRVSLAIHAHCDVTREKCPAYREVMSGLTPIRGASER